MRTNGRDGPAAGPVPVAVVSGSGLAVLPLGFEAEDEWTYEELGWPVTQVAGHPNRLQLARTPEGERLYLACGRPHSYEGWEPSELERPLADMARWGVRRAVLTCAAGGLTERAPTGSLVVADRVIDLQSPVAAEEPEVLAATAAALCEPAVAALQPHLPAVRGAYAAVLGPQYETPAEAGWLAGLADAVGMSGAPEVRAARRLGLTVVMIAAVVNRSAESLDHAEVLAAGGRLQAGLRVALAELLYMLRIATTGPGTNEGAVA